MCETASYYLENIVWYEKYQRIILDRGRIGDQNILDFSTRLGDWIKKNFCETHS